MAWWVPVGWVLSGVGAVMSASGNESVRKAGYGVSAVGMGLSMGSSAAITGATSGAGAAAGQAAGQAAAQGAMQAGAQAGAQAAGTAAGTAAGQGVGQALGQTMLQRGLEGAGQSALTRGLGEAAGRTLTQAGASRLGTGAVTQGLSQSGAQLMAQGGQAAGRAGIGASLREAGRSVMKNLKTAKGAKKAITLGAGIVTNEQARAQQAQEQMNQQALARQGRGPVIQQRHQEQVAAQQQMSAPVWEDSEARRRGWI